MGRGGTGIHRAADSGEHMGRQLRQTLHVFQAGVEITAGDHRAIQSLEQRGGHADQLLLHRSRFRGAGHDLAAGETGAIQIMFVGHQARQALTIGDAGCVGGVVEQAQATVGWPPGGGVFGHHKHREMVGDVLSQHRHRGRGACGDARGAHQASFSIIWWCST